MIRKLIERVESKILTKLFLRWVRNEYDLELLELSKSMIVTQENKIKTILDGMGKVEVTGFKNYENA
mgnify:CR=1 FL=1